MAKRRGWSHAAALELVEDGWTTAQLAKRFGVTQQAVYLVLVRAGAQTESMRRRRVSGSDPLRVKGIEFEGDFIARVEGVRLEMERRRPGERTAWAPALRTLADEALKARGGRGTAWRKSFASTRPKGSSRDPARRPILPTWLDPRSSRGVA